MRTSLRNSLATIGVVGLTSTGLFMAPSAQALEGSSAACEDAEEGKVVEAATADLPLPEGFEGDEWTTVEADFDGCAGLSYAVVTIEGGTGSSPYQVMLFNGTEYVGTATEQAYGFEPEAERVDDDTVNVSYSYLKEGDANADASGTAEASFSWDWETEEVLVSGEFPPE